MAHAEASTLNFYHISKHPLTCLVDPQGTDGGATAVLGGGAIIGSGGGALGGAIVAAAPPAAIAAGGAILIYGAWQLGEYIARRNYPEQYPDTQTESETCSTKSKPVPQPAPTPTPVPQSVPTPSGSRGRYFCNAKCIVENFSNIPNAPEWCYGSGSGASERDACQAAKDEAQASSPRGTYARHCRCTSCWKL